MNLMIARFVCLRRAGVHVISIGNANLRHKNVVCNFVHAKTVFLPAKTIAFELFLLYYFSNNTREAYLTCSSSDWALECTYCICACAEFLCAADDVTLSALVSYNLCHIEIASDNWQPTEWHLDSAHIAP